jgi:proteasome lid subunit RPN8/RPN11
VNVSLLPPREIRIRRHALEKLLLYAERCPVEIGGLGTVVQDAEGLLITDVVLLAQKVSAWDTELDAEALFGYLGHLVAGGGDAAGVRLWWHSHGDMDLVWSDTDCDTIANLPGDFWVALLVNRRGEVACRLDAFTPRRQTWDLPLTKVLDGDDRDLETLRFSIDREILEKVRAYAVIEDVVGSESVAGLITEYPISLTLDPAHAPVRRDDAGREK